MTGSPIYPHKGALFLEGPFGAGRRMPLNRYSNG